MQREKKKISIDRIGRSFVPLGRPMLSYISLHMFVAPTQARRAQCSVGDPISLPHMEAGAER